MYRELCRYTTSYFLPDQSSKMCGRVGLGAQSHLATLGACTERALGAIRFLYSASFREGFFSETGLTVP